MQRRAFLKLFLSATAAIVADPRVILADTSPRTTALATRPLVPEDLVWGPSTIEPVLLDLRCNAHLTAQLMAQFAQQMAGMLGVPEHMLFGRGGAPTADHYYEHLAEQQRRWHAEATRRAVDILDTRIIKGMEAATYDVQILPT